MAEPPAQSVEGAALALRLARPTLPHLNKSLPSPGGASDLPEQPCTPVLRFDTAHGTPSEGSEANAAVPRRPFHRSLTAPLSARLGALKHPGGGVGSERRSERALGKQPERDPAGAGSATGPSQGSSTPTNRGSESGGAESGTPQPAAAAEPASPGAQHVDALRHAISAPAHLGTGQPSTTTDTERLTTMASYSSLVADTLQLPITTLLQVIPPHLLDPSHERLSAMSLQVPVASVEALLEACRTLNWLCARMGGPDSGPNVRADALSGEAPGVIPAQSFAGAAGLQHRAAVAAAHVSGAAPADVPSVPAESQVASSSSGSLQLSSASLASLSLPVDFDILEMGQRVADVVSGQAAENGVHLVLYQAGDALASTGSEAASVRAGMSVRGDEGAVRFAMIHVLSRTIASALTGATIEVGIHIDRAEATDASAGNDAHRYSLQVTLNQPHTASAVSAPGTLRHPPSAQLLRDTGAGVEVEELQLGPDDASASRIRQVIRLPLVAGAALIEAAHRDSAETEARQRFLPALELAEEPSASELATFAAKELRGKKIALHASPTSVFARHLSETLASFGCETARLPLEGALHDSEERLWTGPGSGEETNAPRTAIALSGNKPSLVHYPSDVGMGSEIADRAASSRIGAHSGAETAVLDPVTGVPVVVRSDAAPQGDGASQGASAPTAPSMARSGSQIVPFSFIMIDDDIDTLQRELLRMRSAISLLHSAMDSSQRGVRPSLRRGPPSSNRQVRRLVEENVALSGRKADAASASDRRNEEGDDSTHAIIYFTSLRNFRMVRDAIQPIVESASAQVAPLPEVIVIPQPAGVRRLLTAMHTAVYKPLVDPFFSPIATSPLSPVTASRAAGGAGWQTSGMPSPGMVPGRSLDADAPHIAAPAPLRKGSKSPDRNPGLRLELPPPPTMISAPLLAAAQHEPAPRARPVVTAAAAERKLASAPSDSVSHGSQPVASEGSQPASMPGAAALPAASASAFGAAGGLTTAAPASPMPFDALGYFSETAARMGSRGASGMVIQSPDGRPAGIFFQPATTSSHGSRTPASQRRGSGENVSQAGGSANGGVGASDGGRRKSESRRGTGEATDITATPRTTRETHAPSGRGSRRKTQGAGTDGASATSDWAYPAGSLFSPQVGIESVLAGSKPPLATPLDEVSRSSAVWDPKHVGIVPSSRLSGAAAKAPSAAGANSAPQPSVHATDAGSSDPAPASAPAHEAAPEPKSPPRIKVPRRAEREGVSVAPPRKTAKASVPQATLAEPAGQHAALSPTSATSPGSPTLPLEAAAHARQSFALPTQPVARRPFAQPQSGLLIGAGFAPTVKKGGGPKRAPVREKVLPPIKVLIVEDNPINLRILTKFMTRKEIAFDVARDGREAVNKWQSGGFHLILMDIQLPVMDGIEATKEIRKLERAENIGVVPSTPPASQAGSQSNRELDAPPPLVATPVSPNMAAQTPFRASVIIVALTASVLNSDRVAALAAGCNDFLNKPVNLNWLERKLWEWGSIQYIVLSGQLRTSAALPPGAAARGQSALAAARESSEVRRGFGSGPDALAKRVASSLHINRRSSPASPKKAAKPAAAPAAEPGAAHVPPVIHVKDIDTQQVSEATPTVASVRQGAAEQAPLAVPDAAGPPAQS